MNKKNQNTDDDIEHLKDILSMVEKSHAFANPVISWEAFEHIPHERGKTWHMVAAAFVLIMVVYAILNNATSMAVAFLLVAGVYKLIHLEQPRRVRTAISEVGIKHGEEIFLFNEIKAFWIVYRPHLVSQLHLLMPKRFPKELSLELGTQNPNTVREYLSRQIPEYEGRDEKGIDLVSRILKL